MVDRRSSFRVEACRSAGPQNQFYVYVSPPLYASQALISRLKRGGYSPPGSSRFGSMWGCARM